MQCASCRFENMPGVGVCGRCGSPLGVSTLAIDVHPPRASTWSKRLRRWGMPFNVVYYEARDAGRDLVRQTGIREACQLDLPVRSRGILERAIVPGWPQFYLGQSLRGRVFLGTYLVLMFLALVFFGTTFGMFLAGLAFSVHVASIVSVLHVGGLRRGAYWSGVVLTFLVLAFGVYAPAGWLLSRAVSPAELNEGGGPLASGDVLLYSPGYYRFHQPQPGDVVVYDQRGGMFVVTSPRQHLNVRVPDGQRVDRILAGPGDRIVWENGQLTVNGQPSPLEPLNPQAAIPRLEMDIPQGHYLILPTVGLALQPVITADIWHRLVLVPLPSIRGRVFFRSYPFTRMQRIS